MIPLRSCFSSYTVKSKGGMSFPSTEQNELAITISATSVPNFQNQCKMLFTELDGASSNYSCVMKNAMANALYGLFTQPRDGRT